jgi:AcrR family transcriptional regulator
MGRWQPDARARLQEAALVLYGERGYEETTVAEIAERAGLTKRTFFRYFTDKREVLFWGSELLERQIVAAIEDAPASAPAFELIGAALEAAAVRFEEVREHAALRHRIIASSPELRERELIKTESLAAAVARTLRQRGFGDTAADLVAHTGMTMLHLAFERWVGDSRQRPFQRIAKEILTQFREIASDGGGSGDQVT